MGAFLVVYIGCFLPCKGTNFSANHNRKKHKRRWRKVVSYPAKVQIFQLITTSLQDRNERQRCFLPCKGTNFSANHNIRVFSFRGFRVVSYPAKVQIFQLITTNKQMVGYLESCFLPCKGTNFSANHNRCYAGVHHQRLFLTLQRYKFFS